LKKAIKALKVAKKKKRGLPDGGGKHNTNWHS